MKTISTTLSAPDISCDGCANAIRRALGQVPGVSTIDVSVPAKTIATQHSETTTTATLIDALDRAGFPATVTGTSSSPTA